jgi:predicted O-methyltransferase YrrM
MYLASAPSVRTLVTVEGSPPLAEMAKESLQEHETAQVVNSLFDEAIDAELPAMGKTVDLAFIDGHHEKVATIHYFKRLLPYLKDGAVVVFDDVSWSYDMRDGWNIISTSPEVAHAIDLGLIGVCVLKREDEQDVQGRYWDLQPVLGKTKIGDPRGWKE